MAILTNDYSFDGCVTHCNFCFISYFVCSDMCSFHVLKMTSRQWRSKFLSPVTYTKWTDFSSPNSLAPQYWQFPWRWAVTKQQQQQYGKQSVVAAHLYCQLSGGWGRRNSSLKSSSTNLRQTCCGDNGLLSCHLYYF